MTRNRKAAIAGMTVIAGALAGACSSETGQRADRMVQAAGDTAESAGADTVANFQGLGRDVGEATSDVGEAMYDASDPDAEHRQARTIDPHATQAQADDAARRADREANRLEQEADRAARAAHDARVRADQVRWEAEHRTPPRP